MESAFFSSLLILLIGIVLFISILFMEFDSDGRSFSRYIMHVERIFKIMTGSLDVKTASPDDAITASAQSTISYIGAASCFIAAIICEAIGDYFNIRRENIEKTEYGTTLNEVYVTAARIAVLRKKIKNRDTMDEWVNFATNESQIELKNEENLRNEALSSIGNANQVTPTDHRLMGRLGDNYKAICDRITRVEIELEFFRNISEKIKNYGASLIDKRERKRILSYIQSKHWAKALAKVSAEEAAEISSCSKRFASNAADDLLAVIGLYVSILALIASPNDTGLTWGWAFFGQLIALIMVGALGSTARVKFINPLVRADRAVLEVVPPIYAVRPIVLWFIMFFIVKWLALPEYLKGIEIFSGIRAVSIDRNFGWIFGAILASMAAMITWIIVGKSRD